MGSIRFHIDQESFHRLPRHPDWAYELWDGQEAHLEYRPQHLRLLRTTDFRAGGDPAIPVLVDAGTPEATGSFLRAAWLGCDPYCSLENGEERLEADLARSLGHQVFTVAALHNDLIVGAAAVRLDHRCAVPLLTWLIVAASARERGVATSLLGAVCSELRSRREARIGSVVSAGNIASLRWHLSRGFEIEPHFDATN